VFNLGIEGMMLMGAVVAFWLSQTLSGPAGVVLSISIAGGAGAGVMMSLIFAFLVVTLRANQTVAGLVLAIFGGALGLSSYLAAVFNLTGTAGRHTVSDIDVAGLKDVPVLGPIVFHQNLFVYASWVVAIGASVYLYRSRAGLRARAVGEDPAAADAMGISVTRYRYAHTLGGGALAGIGGACFSLAITTSWTNGLTAGAGWIALTLPILSAWRPLLVPLAAYLFGITVGLGPALQARGVALPPELFAAWPYLATIGALVLVSTTWRRGRFGAPEGLGVPYFREER
jgi:simple sugar transport system permease protein